MFICFQKNSYYSGVTLKAIVKCAEKTERFEIHLLMLLLWKKEKKIWQGQKNCKKQEDILKGWMKCIAQKKEVTKRAVGTSNCILKQPHGQ